MSSTAAQLPPGSPTAVLARARDHQRQRDALEVELARDVADWCGLHCLDADDDPTDAASWLTGRAVPLAGDGAPAVTEASVVELAAALGRSHEAALQLVATTLELCHRLPRLWAATLAGRVPVWRARRVADHTITLSPRVAAAVDTAVTPVAGRCGLTQLDRIITAARTRHDPEPADRVAAEAPDRRRFDIHTGDVSVTGTVPVTGELDLTDALDLDHAIHDLAGQLADLGSTQPLDARRAAALGELARSQLPLDLPTYQTSDTAQTAPDQAASEPPTRRVSPSRPVVLYLHLSEAAITGAGRHGDSEETKQVGRVENTRTPVTAEQIKHWCGNPGTTVTVKPVIDLPGPAHVEAYEIPDRIREHVVLTDPHCVWPWCTRPARRCDLDHRIPHHCGGPTCPCNLAPLCRRHHRHKTHHRWRYTTLGRGVYLWTSPYGHRYLRDTTGTQPLHDCPTHDTPAHATPNRHPPDR